jgi:hypothetical protein
VINAQESTLSGWWKICNSFAGKRLLDIISMSLGDAAGPDE